MTSRQGLVYLKVVFYERFGVKEPLKEDLSRRHSNLANIDKPDVRCFIYNCKCFKPKNLHTEINKTMRIIIIVKKKK